MISRSTDIAMAEHFAKKSEAEPTMLDADYNTELRSIAWALIAIAKSLQPIVTVQGEE